MRSAPPRRVVVLGLLTALILFLMTISYIASTRPERMGKLGELATNVGDHVQDLLHKPEPEPLDDDFTAKEPPKIEEDLPVVDADAKSEKGFDEVGKHIHVRPSAATPKNAGIEGCKYPIMIHVTPDKHCTGALALYGSIVRNVLQQPEALQNKTCVHFTFVDPDLVTIEAMYKWPARKNPFTHVKDCAALDTSPSLNSIVPVRFQGLMPIEKPEIMEAGLETWLAALNKVHSWGFDIYPRILILDADSIILTDMHLIFDETDPRYTISGAPDEFANCGDRGRLNGGMILLRPSRYFHMSATELLYDRDGSCVSGKWQQSEQELLNCICGTNGPVRAARPEFACNIMPLYNSVWPKNYGCSVVNIIPMRSIHFTAATKPWLVDDKRLHERFDYGFWGCVRDATRKGDTKALQECSIPDPEVTRKVVGGLPPAEK